MASTDTQQNAGPGRLQTKSVIAGGAAGNPIKIVAFPATVTLICSSSSGKVQFSTSQVADIDAGSATWQDWSKGVISATASDVTDGPITAVRGVSSSGSVTLEVVQ